MKTMTLADLQFGMERPNQEALEHALMKEAPERSASPEEARAASQKAIQQSLIQLKQLSEETQGAGRK